MGISNQDIDALELIWELPFDDPLRQLLVTGIPLDKAREICKANIEIAPIIAAYRVQMMIDNRNISKALNEE